MLPDAYQKIEHRGNYLKAIEYLERESVRGRGGSGGCWYREAREGGNKKYEYKKEEEEKKGDLHV